MNAPLAVTYFIYHDPGELARHAARHLVEQAASAVAKRGRARLALSGGSTPKRTFELLADPAAEFRQQMPWEKLEIYWVDERCVSPADKDSNYRMTREALLDKVPVPAAQIFRMEGELDPEEAAARYESQIRGQFRLEGAELPRFDAVSLGMGDDGHTASLFPHTEAINELGRIAVANPVAQKQAWRLTLTWPVLNQARNVFFLIQGGDKAAVLERVFCGDYRPEELPAQLIRPASRELLLLLDETAAKQLPAPGPEGFGRLEVVR